MKKCSDANLTEAAKKSLGQGSGSGKNTAIEMPKQQSSHLQEQLDL